MRETRSGRLCSESAERQPGSLLTSQDHSFDCNWSWQITGQRNPGMNEEIRAADRGMVMQRVGLCGAGMVRINAYASQ